MHIISELKKSPNTILTKCSKMTEEENRRHGMNGNVDGDSKEECQRPNYGLGGRLKFFKDGKFILELERAREGERVSWVSVPRKTFWPPPGTTTPSTPSAYRQDGSTSLSVSDDNSSVQSSPWQRDHSWKQTTPRRNISKEMSFFFWRSKRKRRPNRMRGIKRRRPLSITEGITKEENSFRNVRKKKRKPLLTIVEILTEKCSRTSTPPRPETVVSPRKRFLREMEKEKSSIASIPNLERPGSCDDTTTNSAQKRSRGRPQGSTCSTGTKTPPSAVIKIEKAENFIPSSVYLAGKCNGIDEISTTTPKPTKNSSYSITSLLAEDHHKNNLKLSPCHSPNRFSPVVTQSGPGRYSSSSATEDRLYSESVDRLRSIDLTQVEKCGYPPSFIAPSHPTYLSTPSLYPYPMLPFFIPETYSRPPRYILPHQLYNDYAIVNPRTTGGVLPPHSAHPHHNPHHHHHQQQLSIAHQVTRRNGPLGPTGSWVPNDTVVNRADVKEECVDMPLNLSKHAE